MEKILALQLPLIQVLIAIGICMVIGAFWYSPKGFGNAWAKALHYDTTEMKAGPFHYLGAMFVSIILVLGIAVSLKIFNIVSLKESMLWASLSWLTFIATTHFSGVIWARKPLRVYLIDVSYLLVIILISSTLLTIWK